MTTLELTNFVVCFKASWTLCCKTEFKIYLKLWLWPV